MRGVKKINRVDPEGLGDAPVTKAWNYRKPDLLKKTVDKQHQLIDEYLERFPSMKYEDTDTKRLSLTGKLNLVVRIEQIYDLSTSRIGAGQLNPSCAVFTQETFNAAYSGHPKACNQSLLNFLYSVSKLKQNDKNLDVQWFDSFLRETVGLNAFCIFLLARLQFQRILEKDIVQRQLLKVDPICTELSIDLMWELLSRIERAFDGHINIGEIFAEKLEEVEKSGNPKLDYYEFMEMLIPSLTVAVSEAQSIKSVRKTYSEVPLQVSAQPLASLDHNPRISHELPNQGGRSFESNRSLSRSRERQPQYHTLGHDRSASNSGMGTSTNVSGMLAHREHSSPPDKRGPPRSSYSPQEEITQIALKADPIRAPPTNTQPHPSYGNRGGSTSRSMNSLGEHEQHDEMEIFLEAEPSTPLNRRIRLTLVALISVFLDILIQDTLGHSGSQGLHNKMNLIVVRKSMNLLTCIFRNSKQGVLELLRISQAFESDKAKINQIFSDYQDMVQSADNHKSVSEERVTSFAKRILKVELFITYIARAVCCSCGEPCEVHFDAAR